MRTLKLALAAVAAFAFNANTHAAQIGMQDYDGTEGQPPGGMYQKPVIAGSQPDAQGFHAGGVAACDGCHVMHNANDGVAKSTTGKGDSVTPWTNVTNMYLLQGSDQSSTCLICHGGKKQIGIQFTVADFQTEGKATNFTPGGDFGWLRFDWANSPAERHGHNVVAADFDLPVDQKMKTAPGGTWTGGEGRKAFACSSCHDPHGRYRMQLGSGPNGIAFVGPDIANALPKEVKPIAASGSYGAEPTAEYAVGAYRLLAGKYYAPASNASSPFMADPPVAVAPMTYNAAETSAEVRVAYGSGMSEWCQNCHTEIHMDNYPSGFAGFRHPAGSDAVLHAGQYQVYNTYISSGRVDPGATSNYTSLVPFEQGKAVTLATLKANATPDSIIAAGPQSAVMCLSCHRAHASAFDSMVRWDQNATFLTDGTNFTEGVTNRGAEATKAGYYDRTVGTGANQIGPYQRSLCNKCHGKD